MTKTKILVRISLFSMILLLLIVILSFLFMPKNNLKDFGMDQVSANGILGEKKNTIDVLILGDSETYTSFSPLQMYEAHGFTSYICGTSGQRLYDSYDFLEKTLENQKPKVVILETNAIFRDYDLKTTVLAKWKNLIPLLKYHNRWKNLTIHDFSSKITYTYTDPNKGFRIKKGIMPVKNHDYMKKMDKSKTIPKLNIHYLDKMKDLCDELGITFILISSKSIKNWNDAKHQSVSNYANQKEIAFYDLNLISEIEIDWQTDTVDKGDHLNLDGAKKVSKYVGDLLKETYDLPDHREDKNYSSWERDLEKYKALVG